MAHYKRGKCRRHGRITFTAQNAILKQLGVKLPLDSERWKLDVPPWVRWPGYGRSPGKFNREFHSRPHRARERHEARRVLVGAVDADEALWPVLRKPTIYFW